MLDKIKVDIYIYNRHIPANYQGLKNERSNNWIREGDE